MPFPRRFWAPLLLVAIAVAACKKGDAADAKNDSAAGTTDSAEAESAPRLALPVAAVEARNGDLVLTVTTTGQVASEGQATLKSEVAGTIQKVLVRAGDRVRQGQRLVEFDPRPLELNVDDAKARLATAQVQYRDQYYADSVVTKRAPTDEQRRTAMSRVGLQQAQVAVEKAELEREKAVVLSPFDGMVDRVDAAPGVRVSAGETLLRVVNLSQLRIEANVLEHDIPLIKEGGQAVVSSAAAPDRPIIGRIAAVLPLVDTTSRSGRAYVRVPGSSLLRPGMYADVRLEAQRLTNRRLVPARAIIQRDGRPLVFVVKDGRAQWVYVNPGRSNGAETEILPDSGTGVIPVEAGDKVVVEGHITLTHDAPVRVIAAGDTAMTKARAKNE
jgi:RND family efflux transporter MFP subunit